MFECMTKSWKSCFFFFFCFVFHPRLVYNHKKVITASIYLLFFFFNLQPQYTKTPKRCIYILYGNGLGPVHSSIGPVEMLHVYKNCTKLDTWQNPNGSSVLVHWTKPYVSHKKNKKISVMCFQDKVDRLVQLQISPQKCLNFFLQFYLFIYFYFFFRLSIHVNYNINILNSYWNIENKITVLKLDGIIN